MLPQSKPSSDHQVEAGFFMCGEGRIRGYAVRPVPPAPLENAEILFHGDLRI